MIVEFLQNIFSSDDGSDFNNFALLGFRALLCCEMIRVHGLKKFGIDGRAEVVPNPLNPPPQLNQFAANFSDLVAPVFVALGLATRLAVLPILAVTLTGYFVVHRRDSASDAPSWTLGSNHGKNLSKSSSGTKDFDEENSIEFLSPRGRGD